MNSSLRLVSIVGITVLALALGGSTELWAQAFIVFLAAILILLSPPRVALGTIPMLVPFLFFGIALSAFLPAGWGPLPEWRQHLTTDLHVPLGDLRTPQPWLTIQACGLLLFGLVWTYYLLAQEWSVAEKSLAFRLFVSGVILLSAAAIFAYFSGQRIPGWDEEQNRGWFPNRNQTADVLALTGIVNYVIAFKSLERKKLAGFFWLAGLIVVCTALIISYSRAGILIFFSGAALWHIGALFRPKEGKHMVLGLSSVLLLLSLFLIFGGTTLDRFMNDPQSSRSSNTTEYRILIQEDALRVSLQAPLLGTGLGNFEPVFTSMREASADQNRTIHPESDWLWMIVEMGWMAPILVILGLGWWVKKSLPFAMHQGESLRRATFIAFILFVVHGFVDVAGHRLGSFFVGLLLASLALAPLGKTAAQSWVTPLFRGLALLLLLLAGWWIASVTANFGPPTTATLDRLQFRLNKAAVEGRIASMSETIDPALEIAPLRWNLYFNRALTEAFRTGATDQAINDFKIARFLEPHWVDLTLNEGATWLAVDQPALCVDAWRDALRRAGPNETNTYAIMLRLSHDKPEIHRGLKGASSTNTNYLITFLENATPEEEKEGIDSLLSHDPNLQTLNTIQQQKLFSAWNFLGDREELANSLLEHTDWQVAGWKFLAQHFAEKQDYQTACLTALKFITPPPAIQSLPKDRSMSAYESHFELHPDNAAEGVFLCQSQINANHLDDALRTMMKLEKLKDCPHYIFYMEGDLHMKREEWEQAWNAFRQYSEP